MEPLKTLDALLETAMAIEEQGSKFYKKAAAAAKDAVAQQLFLDLVEWENAHYAEFDSIRRGLAPDERRSKSTADGLEIGAVVASGALKVARDPASLLTGSEAPEDVIDIAISLERDSITFYMFIHGLLRDVQRLKELNVVIREEIGHVGHLQKLRDRLTGGRRAAGAP